MLNNYADPTKFADRQEGEAGKLLIIIGGGVAHVPPGDYKARITQIRKTSFKGKRDTYCFVFEVVDGQHKGVVINGYANAQYKKFSKHTKLYRWITAVEGQEPELEEGYDLEVMKDAILLVRVKDTQTTQKQVVSNVEEIISKLDDF
ncbi:MAG: hypothetical protein K2Q26_09030 [Bdellovibrionales bacterium]|nr:hypothetical protein [Bdellovibrionales bacterium]